MEKFKEANQALSNVNETVECARQLIQKGIPQDVVGDIIRQSIDDEKVSKSISEAASEMVRQDMRKTISGWLRDNLYYYGGKMNNQFDPSPGVYMGSTGGGSFAPFYKTAVSTSSLSPNVWRNISSTSTSTVLPTTSTLTDDDPEDPFTTAV